MIGRSGGRQYWKSSSRYFGSGQRSSATSVSSSSTTARSASWAGMTVVANAFASAWTEPASWASCWACSSASIASTSESARPETCSQIALMPARRRRRGELAEVPGDGRQDHRRGDVDGAVRLDVLDLDVALPVDLDARRELALGQHAEAREERLRLLGGQRRQRVDRRPVVRQPAAGGLGVPLLGVAVALEQDLLVGLDDARQDRGQALEVAGLELVELVGELLERIGDGRVEDRLRPVDRRRRADRAELELVAGEGERRGPVAVGGVGGEDRQRGDAELDRAALLGGRGRALLELGDDVLELRAEEDRDDRRRGLVGAQAMVVAGVGDARPEQVGVDVDAADDRHEERQELGVGVRVVARGRAGSRRRRSPSTSCCACPSR